MSIVVDVFYGSSDVRYPADEARLVQAVETAGNVVLPIMFDGRISEKLPTSDVVMAARDVGHVFLPIDDDGMVRRVYLKAGLRDAHWSHLSLAAMESIGEAPSPLPGVVHNLSNQENVVLVGDHEVLIPFHGPKNTFRAVSAVDVLVGDYDSSDFRDAVVFFGLTATGLSDSVPTPIHGLAQPLSGVEVLANIYSALRADRTTAQSSGYTIYLIAALSIALLLCICMRRAPLWGFFWTLVFTAAPIILSLLFYRLGNIWFAPLVASGTILIAFLGWNWAKYYQSAHFSGRQ